MEKPDVITIQGVAFGLVPYPTKEALAPHYDQHAGGAPRNVALGTAYANLVRTFAQRLAQHEGPAVFCAHVTVAGVTTPSGHEIKYDSDLRLGTGDLPNTGNLAYIALGHIHQPQEVNHVVPCYYSGSLDRLDWGEWQDEKQALLVDIPAQGAAQVEALSLDVTPYYKLGTTPADIEDLPERYPDLDRAVVEITLTCEEGDNPIALRRRLLELCPRCTNGVALVLPEQENEFKPLVERPDNVASTTLAYLQERFGEDPDFDELKTLTQGLLDELNA
ncbi:MAG: exonuclease SbcCD subunit D [Rhodothermales bacterium]